MYAGKPVEIGTVDDIFYRPRMPYTLGLIGSLPRLDLADETLTPITGAPPSLISLPPGCPFSPRCPLAAEICLETEPELVATTAGSHLAACHRWRELEGDVAADDVFAVTATDALVPADASEALHGDAGEGSPS
jgi:peptide/nickel transport system ATP-binding protein